MPKNKPSQYAPYALLVLLILAFCLSLFKNISYPLLWNDEADTAMFATQVLEYGYPKVHDGKNVLYVYPVDMKIGTREQYDLYTANPLLGYYWAVPGVLLAKFADNLYTKTMLLRIPFAVTGLLALLVFALLPLSVFQEKPSRKIWFLVFFVFLELLSVSITLHIREVRYYSPLLLFTAGVLYLYARHRILPPPKPGFGLYAGAMTALLLLIFNTFYPLFFILLGSLGLHEAFCLFQKIRASRRSAGRQAPLVTFKDLKPFLPLVISVVMVLPLLFFFRTFEVAFASQTGVPSQWANHQLLYNMYRFVIIQLSILKFMAIYEFLPLAIFLKAILLTVLYRRKGTDAILPKAIAGKIRVSNFLTLFFIVHLLVLGNMPGVFTRYFLVLQPVLTLILLLDAFAAFDLLRHFPLPLFSFSGKPTKVFVLMTVVVFLLSCTTKITDFKGHVYELTHRYKGPLDFVIPYIKANFQKPQDLTIATNYEEHCFMYYLGSKVIIGCNANNLQEDLQETPDMIIDRKSWPEMSPYLERLQKKALYETISFPVADYWVNNIPELYYYVRHLYRTPVSLPSFGPLTMFVKAENPAMKK